ncbi:MAG: phosphonoacetaldehyde hydrolase [Planctomycetia bacterium]
MTHTLNDDRRILAVLLDWAGTAIDHGSRAPARVFVEVFAAVGIELTESEARGPMGLAKRDHVAAILALPRVDELWSRIHQRHPSPEDVDDIYRRFLPLQKAVLADHCEPIPGVVETVDFCRRHGIAIGSTTGYTRELMDVVIPAAARAGFAPDVVICSDEIPAGRPAPWANFRAAEKLRIYPPAAIIVIDDTAPGVAAGRNAGMPTLGVTLTGNGLGLSAEALARLAADERAQRAAAVGSMLLAAGADGCLGGVADLPAWLEARDFRSPSAHLRSSRV